MIGANMVNKVILIGNLGKDPDTRFTSKRQGRDKILACHIQHVDLCERRKAASNRMAHGCSLGKTGRGLRAVPGERASSLRRRRASIPVLRQQRGQGTACHRDRCPEGSIPRRRKRKGKRRTASRSQSRRQRYPILTA